MNAIQKFRRMLGIRSYFIAILERSGYWIQERKNLPVGADLAEDVRHKLLIEPRIIFDVGANVGQTAVVFSSMFPRARVKSFEPISSTFEQLLLNTRDLPTVACFHLAFGDEEGTTEVSLYDPEQSYLNSLKPSHGSLDSQATKEKVQVTTIDSFVESNDIKRIDLLKIDTEGYEIEVLKGATKTIRRGGVKLILAEISLSPSNTRNTSLTDIICFLEPFNYSLIGLYDTNLRFLKEGLPYSNALFFSNLDQVDPQSLDV